MKIISIKKLSNDLEEIRISSHENKYLLRTGLGGWFEGGSSSSLTQVVFRAAELEKEYMKYKSREKREELSRRIIQQINESRGSFGGVSFEIVRNVFGNEVFRIIKDYFTKFISNEEPF